MLTGQTLGGGSQVAMPIPTHPLTNGGNLANSGSQISLATKEGFSFDVTLLFESFYGGVHPGAPPSKLSDLKRRAFPESGRMQRIAKSLAAVNAVQPTQLSPSEWRRIAEADIEDQY